MLKSKRLLSMILAIFMLVSMLTGIVLPAASAESIASASDRFAGIIATDSDSDGVYTPAANVVFVNPSFGSGDYTGTFEYTYGDGTSYGNGLTYELTYGINAFTNLYQGIYECRDAWNNADTTVAEYTGPDTVVVAPGTYGDNQWQNNEWVKYDLPADWENGSYNDLFTVNVIGPQAGVSPVTDDIDDAAPEAQNGRSIDPTTEAVSTSTMWEPLGVQYIVDGMALAGQHNFYGGYDANIPYSSWVLKNIYHYVTSYYSKGYFRGTALAASRNMEFTNYYLKYAQHNSAACSNKIIATRLVWDNFYEDSTEIEYEASTYTQAYQIQAYPTPSQNLREGFLGEGVTGAHWIIKNSTINNHASNHWMRFYLETGDFANAAKDSINITYENNHFYNCGDLVRTTYGGKNAATTADPNYYGDMISFQNDWAMTTKGALNFTFKDNVLEYTIAAMNDAYDGNGGTTAKTKGGNFINLHTLNMKDINEQFVNWQMSDNTMIFPSDAKLDNSCIYLMAASYTSKVNKVNTETKNNVWTASYLMLNEKGEVCTFWPSYHVINDIYAGDDFAGGVKELFTIVDGAQMAISDNNINLRVANSLNGIPVAGFNGTVMIVPQANAADQKPVDLFRFRGEGVEFVKLLDKDGNEVTDKVNPNDIDGYQVVAQYKGKTTVCTVTYTITIAPESEYAFIDPSGTATSYTFNGNTYTLDDTNRWTDYTKTSYGEILAAGKNVVVFLPGSHNLGGTYQVQYDVALLGPQFGVSPLTDDFTLNSARDGLTKVAENSYTANTAKEAVLTGGKWQVYATETTLYMDGFTFAGSKVDLQAAQYTWAYAKNGSLTSLTMKNCFVNGWSGHFIGGWTDAHMNTIAKQAVYVRDVYAAGLGSADQVSFLNAGTGNVDVDHFYAENATTNCLFRTKGSNGQRMLVHPQMLTFELTNSKMTGISDNYNFIYPNFASSTANNSWQGTPYSADPEYFPAGFKIIIDGNIFENCVSSSKNYSIRPTFTKTTAYTASYFTNNTVYFDVAPDNKDYYFYTPSFGATVTEHKIEGNVMLNLNNSGFYLDDTSKTTDGNVVDLDENYYAKIVNDKDKVTPITPTLAESTQKSDWYYIDRAMTTKNTEVLLEDNGYKSFDLGTFDGINHATITSENEGLTAENAFKAIQGAEVVGVYEDEDCTTQVTGAFTKPNNTVYVMVKKTATGVGCVTKVTMTLPCAHAGERTAATRVEATCGTDGYQEYTCDDCGAVVDAWTETLTATQAHTWNSGEVSIEPTCQVKGTTLYTCTNENCLPDGTKATKTEQDIPVVPCESDGTWNVVTAPKCEVDGSETQNCKWCDAVLATQAIPQIGHDWDEGVEDPVHNCLSDGVMTYTCKNDSSHTYTQEVPSTGEHNFVGTVITPATCTTPGIIEYKCDGCGTSHQEAIPVTGHNYVATTTKEPTCVEDGILTYTCQNVINGVVCGDSYTTPAPANGSHDYKAEVTKYPTCTEDGVMTYTCQRANCGAVTSEVIPNKGGHQFGDWIQRKPATCTVPGVEYRICIECEEEETRDTALIDHVYDTEFTIDIQPTGTVKGEKSRHCLICKDARTDITDLGYCEHTNTTGEWIIDRETSCKAAGEKHQICADCGDNCNITEIPALPHQYIETNINVAATCTTNGERELTCTVCNNKTTEVIDATGHNPGAWRTTTEPTCTAPGEATQYCTTCNAPLATRTVDAKGHGTYTWITTTPADCVNAGIASYTCGDCGAVSDTKAIPAKGHSAVHIDTIPATCTETGLRDYECAVCGQSDIDVVIPATGHTAGKWETVTPATTLSYGVKVKYCTVCGEEVERAIIEQIVCSGNPFKDVASNAWYKKAVNFVYCSGLMNGTSATTFSPNVSTTRGMFVTILGRLSGINADQYTNAYFEDVKDGSYYFGYIEWARVNGIIQGTGNYVFEPDRAITRQEMCKMIISYADYEEITLQYKNSKTTFKDDAKIAKWAKTYVYACQRAGIVSGDTSGSFRPTDTANRAEIATLIMNFYVNCMK